MDKAVKPVSYPAVSHNDNADTAHTGTALIRRLEIYRRKIFHPNPFTLFYIRLCLRTHGRHSMQELNTNLQNTSF